MKKKLLCTLLAFLLMAGTFAACGRAPNQGTGESANETGNSQGSAPTEGTNKITIWSRDNPDSTAGKAFASDIAAFQELHPELEIDYVSIPHSDVITKWNTAFAGNIAPDVMDVGVSHIIQRVQLGHLVPLDEYYENWDGKDNLPSGMVDYGRFDDQIYAIAYNSSPTVFAWRKDYFEEAGLDPETPPQSWEEMLEFAEKLTVMENGRMVRGGLELPDTRGASILFQFFIQNEANEIDYENDVPNFTDPAAVEAAEFLAELSPYAMLKTDGDAGVFIAGSAAMALTIGVESLQSMLEENPELEEVIGVTASLREKKGGMHSGAWLYGISSQAEDPDLAWEFIEFVFSEERCRARMEEVGMVPPLLSLRDEYIALSPTLHGAQLDNLTQVQAYPKLDWTNLYEETLHRAYEEIIYGQKDPAQALADAEKEIQDKR